METQTPKFRLIVMPLVFVLVCTLVSIFMYRAFGGTTPLEPKGYRFSVPLPSADNLFEGSDVQSSGLKVGEVKKVERTRDGKAVAVIDMDHEYAPVRSGARAILRLKTLVGEGYLALAPGPTNAPAIPDGGSLAASHVRPSLRLDDFLSTFDPTTRKHLQQMFAGVASSLDKRAPALNDSLGSAAPFTANLDQLLHIADGQRSDIRTLVASSATMYGALGARQGALQAAVTSGNEMLNVTADRNRALEATVHALPPFLRQLRGTATTLASASPDLNRAVTSLVPVAPLLTPALKETQATMPKLQALFKALPATLEAGDRGLPALTRTQRAEPAGFRQLYPLSRQLIPLLQVAGANQRGLVGVLANAAAATNGRQTAPDGRVVPYVNAVVTVWNEALGGPKKRLPSNRQNPYPKPGSLADIANGGLKSFDCRNLGNLLYLPTLGSGTPPCIVQGPWTFPGGGPARYFPHLEEAAP